MEKRKATYLSFFLACLLFPLSTLAFPARVIGITDGDTVKVLTKENELLKIRLAEIDTPERKQPWGTRAKQALAEIVMGKIVEVKPVTVDRYGRTVAHLYLGKLSINKEMVRTGNAWVYRKYVTDSLLLDLEAIAKEHKKGLWGLDESQIAPPWEWRRKNR